MHQAGLRDPTHPSKEYLLVLGMSMMSMKPRFPAGSRWGMEGRWPPTSAWEPGLVQGLLGPGQALKFSRNPSCLSLPHTSQPSLTC